jgi:hypothetical protein
MLVVVYWIVREYPACIPNESEKNHCPKAGDKSVFTTIQEQQHIMRFVTIAT